MPRLVLASLAVLALAACGLPAGVRRQAQQDAPPAPRDAGEVDLAGGPASGGAFQDNGRSGFELAGGPPGFQMAQAMPLHGGGDEAVRTRPGAPTASLTAAHVSGMAPEAGPAPTVQPAPAQKPGARTLLASVALWQGPSLSEGSAGPEEAGPDDSTPLAIGRVAPFALCVAGALALWTRRLRKPAATDEG